MNEEEFKQLFSEYYKTAYYINLANFGDMTEAKRRKFYDWLQKETKQILMNHDHTFCANDFVDDLVMSLVRYTARKIDFDVAQKKGGYK